MIDKAALILVGLWIGSVSTLFAQTEYTADGEPTALEEEIRWLVNRGRFDSARENQTWSTSYTDIPATAAPLAPHHAITLASRHHSEDMARNNLFQHATIPGSAYYDAVTQPTPWDRMRAEGYNYNSAAENIAAGYGSAQAAYIGWWNSGGHRRNMFNADHREIGNGYFNWSSSDYRRYYTMDLGRSGSAHFFTGTLFHDANGDGAYNQGEGRPGIRVLLQIGGAAHSHFDVSASAGSFAVPIQSIADGSTVQVLLASTTSSPLSISLPRGYGDYAEYLLGPGEVQLVGSYVQTNSVRNVGFRDLAPPAFTLVAPVLAVVQLTDEIQLRWPSQVGAQYRPQATSDWVQWINVSPAPLAGTGGEMSVSTELPGQDQTRRFFRVLAQ
jgi:hypothetical protein